MGSKLKLTSDDGHELGAYRADPTANAVGGLVVIQEIFGVNTHIRAVCDRLADHGYVAIAPALFDRFERDYEAGYTPDDVARGRGFLTDINWDWMMADTAAAKSAIADVGKIGIVGYCLGGAVAFLAATRLDGLAAASCYYGGRIVDFADAAPKCPTQLHYGATDESIPLSDVEIVQEKRPDCDIHIYAGAGHGFNCDMRASYHPVAAKRAWDRTMALMATQVG